MRISSLRHVIDSCTLDAEPSRDGNTIAL